MCNTLFHTSTRSLLEYLGEQKIRSVYVEGGAGVHGSLVDAAQQDFLLLDRVLFYIAPAIMGGNESLVSVRGNGSEKLATMLRCSSSDCKKVGENYKITGYLNHY